MKFNVKDIVLIDDPYPDDDVYREAYIVYHGAVLGSVREMKSGDYLYRTLWDKGGGTGGQPSEYAFEYFTVLAIGFIEDHAKRIESGESLK